MTCLFTCKLRNLLLQIPVAQNVLWDPINSSLSMGLRIAKKSGEPIVEAQEISVVNEPLFSIIKRINLYAGSRLIHSFDEFGYMVCVISKIAFKNNSTNFQNYLNRLQLDQNYCETVLKYQSGFNIDSEPCKRLNIFVQTC